MRGVVGRRSTVAALATILRVSLVLVLVLLRSLFSKMADKGTADRPEETVVGLVAGETTGSTTSESAANSTLTLLGTARTTLFVRSNTY